MILNGDCLKELTKVESCSVDLVYLDPPFFTQKKQVLKTRDNLSEYSFEDTWTDINSYTAYIQERLKKCKAVLKNSGSIFLHCDRSASHHLRIALDNVFGSENFRSEIIWVYKRWSNAKKGLLNSHQIIFFYSKTSRFKFNRTFTDYSPTTNLEQIFEMRVRDKNGKTVYKKAEDGNSELMREKKGVPLSDVWEIPYLNPKARERVGYPTQKPIILLERIIELVTDTGDLVLDPFCGSGTTLIAAKLLDRNYIGIDASCDAVKLTEKRLEVPIKSESNLMLQGKNAYLKQDIEVLKVLKTLHAITVQRNRGIDGFLKFGDSFRPIPVKVQKQGETLEVAKELLLRACSKKGYHDKVLIKTRPDENGQLFPVHNGSEDAGLTVVRDINSFVKERERFVAS